jgi:hypothetical protein
MSGLGTGANGPVYKVTLDLYRTGLLVGGDFSSWNGDARKNLVQLTLEIGQLTTYVSGPNAFGGGPVYDIVPVWYQPSQSAAFGSAAQHFLVAGAFTGSFEFPNGGVYAMPLYDYLSGSAIFPVGEGLNGTAYNILYQKKNGNVLVGGSFSSYNGSTSNNILLLDVTGSKLY